MGRDDDALARRLYEALAARPPAGCEQRVSELEPRGAGQHEQPEQEVARTGTAVDHQDVGQSQHADQAQDGGPQPRVPPPGQEATGARLQAHSRLLLPHARQHPPRG